jgi:asparagine synthase (glutamine-hydrolysing)
MHPLGCASHSIAQSAPFFEVRVRADGVTVSGPSTFRVGQATGEQGIFAEWRWDGTSLHVRNDRFGFQPLYSWISETGVALSTSIEALLAAGAPAELDHVAIAVLLRLGFMVGEDTPYRHIRALPPGARLTWRPGEVRMTQTLPLPPPIQISRDEAIERHIALFRAAVRRRAKLPGVLALPLSGGQDSRHILFELIECGRSPALCVTARYHPPRATPDAEIASEVAALLGVHHEVVEPAQSLIRALLSHHRATGFCTLTPSFFIAPVAEFLAGRADLVFDGIGGDVLCAGLFLDTERVRLFRNGQLAALADQLLSGFNGGGGYDEETLRRAFGPRELQRFSRSAAVERLTAELSRHAGAANPMTSFAFFNRTRRDIALIPLVLLAPIVAVQCPYLDDDFYDFMASLPPEMLLDRQFHADCITRAFPRGARIPYARWQRASPDAAAARYRRLARELSWHCAGGLRPRALKFSFTAPRLLRCLADSEYAPSSAWLAPLLVYLTQMEALLGGTLANPVQSVMLGATGPRDA